MTMRRSFAVLGVATLAFSALMGCQSSADTSQADSSNATNEIIEPKVQECLGNEEPVASYPPEWTDTFPIPVEVSSLCVLDLTPGAVVWVVRSDTSSYSAFSDAASTWLTTMEQSGYVVNIVQGSFSNWTATWLTSKTFVAQIVPPDGSYNYMARLQVDEFSVAFSLQKNPPAVLEQLENAPAS